MGKKELIFGISTYVAVLVFIGLFFLIEFNQAQEHDFDSEFMFSTAMLFCNSILIALVMINIGLIILFLVFYFLENKEVHPYVLVNSLLITLGVIFGIVSGFYLAIYAVYEERAIDYQVNFHNFTFIMGVLFLILSIIPIVIAILRFNKLRKEKMGPRSPSRPQG